MPAGQCKLRAFIVIERRWRPALIHMAIRAFCYASVFGGKLAAVRVYVACFAILWGSLELNFVGSGQSFVALAAHNDSMRSRQREFCFRMVESTYVNPGASAVARFAAERRSICFFRRHAIFKFTLVGIGVARSACAVLKMEWQNFVYSSAQACLVAFRAGYGHVGSGQHEMSLLVLGDSKCGAMKILYRVAIFATVLVGRGGKLFIVFILMAICARRELHFVLRIFSGWRVAFVAGNSRMLAFERILRCRVLFHSE